MIAGAIYDHAARLRSFEIVAEAMAGAHVRSSGGAKAPATETAQNRIAPDQGR